MCVCLSCQESTVEMKELESPPEGYHSVRGVASTDDVTSFFKVRSIWFDYCF